MSQGTYRSILAKTIIEFNYNGFFSELPMSININLIGKKFIPDIEYNPANSDNFILATFNLVAEDSITVIAKFRIKMKVYYNFSISTLEGSLVGYHDLVRVFIEEVYEQYFKAKKDIEKLNQSLNRLKKLQTKTLKERVKK